MPINSKRQNGQKTARRLKETSRREKPAKRSPQQAQPENKKKGTQGGSPFIFPSEPQEGQ
jgi:hypothetical protein